MGWRKLLSLPSEWETATTRTITDSRVVANGVGIRLGVGMALKQLRRVYLIALIATFPSELGIADSDDAGVVVYQVPANVQRFDLNDVQNLLRQVTKDGSTVESCRPGQIIMYLKVNQRKCLFIFICLFICFHLFTFLSLKLRDLLTGDVLNRRQMRFANCLNNGCRLIPKMFAYTENLSSGVIPSGLCQLTKRTHTEMFTSSTVITPFSFFFLFFFFWLIRSMLSYYYCTGSIHTLHRDTYTIEICNRY